MGILINNETSGKERNRLCRVIVAAMRELVRIQNPDDRARDLAACIAVSLERIHAGIDGTVEAWEKRDFWKKADRYRMEWEWTLAASERMGAAVLNDDWGAVAACCMELAGRLSGVVVSENHRLGTPWDGAYAELVKRHG